MFLVIAYSKPQPPFNKTVTKEKAKLNKKSQNQRLNHSHQMDSIPAAKAALGK
jgi:hypothetical protein